MRLKSILLLAAVALATLAHTASSAHAQLVGELGVFDPLNADGGINPQTGVAWAAGDQYRLAFYTSVTRDATSSDINVYNSFVQNVAANSTAFPLLGNGSWKVLGSTPTVSARENTGTGNNTTLTNVPVPIYVTDGQTRIAIDSNDMWDGFTGSSGSNVRTGTVFYSPYLDENGGGDSGVNHGVDVFTGSNSNGTIRTPLGGTTTNGNGDPISNRGASNANNSGRVFIRFDNTTQTSQLHFYALSDPLTVTNMSGPDPDTPVSLLSTDFAGRTVSGATASNIPWVTNGIADPGDLTAVDINNAAPGTFALFDTTAAQNHFAPDLNVQNEGPWSVDIPISVEVSSVEVEKVVLDWQHFNNSGAFQSDTINRPVDWLAELIGTVDGTIASEMGNVGTGGFGVLELDFGMPVELTDDQEWILRLTANQPTSSGNNTGLNAINVIGFVNTAAVPEPASVAIWSLIGLGSFGFGVYRVRRKK